jgi:hypothetical protein
MFIEGSVLVGGSGDREGPLEPPAVGDVVFSLAKIPGSGILSQD